jgi:hypothetical protein
VVDKRNWQVQECVKVTNKQSNMNIDVNAEPKRPWRKLLEASPVGQHL